MKKNIFTKFCILTLLLTALMVNTYAYFIDVNEAEVVNEATTARCAIKIVEEYIPPAGKLPIGSDITKIVEVKNYPYSVDSYVRVFAEFSNEYERKAFDVDFNTTDWEKIGDYWYYKKPLKGGEFTTPLMTRLRTKEAGYPFFEFIVYAEGVQAAGYTNPLDAFNAIA